MTLFDVMPDAEKARIGLWTPQKAETGPGALAMMYDSKMSMVLGKRDPHALIKAGQLLYHTNPWVNAAERAITNAFSGVEWHLEDENDEDIEEEATPEQAAARDLIERPQAALPKDATQGLTRSRLWKITSRHMGLCGTAFWVGDQMSLDGIPLAFLYVNPSRMTPVSNPNGYLIGYRLDAVPYDPNSGYPLTLDEVFAFHLEPGDDGHWGIGLAEASGMLTQLYELAVRHSGGVLSSGGRLAGITMPKPGTEMDDEAWKSLVRDMRTVSEDPNAAKRNLIIRKPMDFLPTAVTPKDLDLMRALEMGRDDILGYWGVPKSQIGLEIAAGLNNGGATKDRDKAMMWEGPVHSRLVPFAEVLQYQLLDRWKTARGVTIELEIEEPDFTEDAPKYANAAAAVSVPLRVRERRAILGLDPLGDPALDEAVWLPLTQTQAFMAPDAMGQPVPPAPMPPEVPGDGTEIEAKASKRPLLGLRRQVDATWTPKMQTAVAKVLADQRAEIAAKVKRNAAHLMAKPTDVASWWDGPRWERAMGKVLEAHAHGIAEEVTGHVASIMAPKKAAPVWAEPVYARLLRKVGLRVTGLLDTTRDAVLSIIQATVKRGIDEGMGAAQLGDALEAALNDAATFDEYRAELIARTETMRAYNDAALGSYTEFGVDKVQAIDGDGDPVCAARDGQVFTTDEAADIEDHPNGTLDWVPYFPEGDVTAAGVQRAYDAGNAELGQQLNREVAAARGGSAASGGAVKATETRLEYDDAGRVVAIIEYAG